MSKRVREMSLEELEDQRQTDVESGAMQYGETAASREIRRRQNSQDSSISESTSTKGDRVRDDFTQEDQNHKCDGCGSPYGEYTDGDVYFCQVCYFSKTN